MNFNYQQLRPPVTLLYLYGARVIGSSIINTNDFWYVGFDSTPSSVSIDFVQLRWFSVFIPHLRRELQCMLSSLLAPPVIFRPSAPIPAALVLVTMMSRTLSFLSFGGLQWLCCKATVYRDASAPLCAFDLLNQVVVLR